MEEKLRQQLKGASISQEELDEQLVTSCQHYFQQKIQFKAASRPDFYLKRLKSRYRPLNPKMPESTTLSNGEPQREEENCANEGKDGIPTPKRVLFDPSLLEMKWGTSRGVGSGLGNMGNTCFLNSVLQCLTYTPPLFNYLTSDRHKNNCKLLLFISIPMS